MENKNIIIAVIGLSIAGFGFIFSDEDKYPVSAKFSGIMIILGIAMAAFAISFFWNPINYIK